MKLFKWFKSLFIQPRMNVRGRAQQELNAKLQEAFDADKTPAVPNTPRLRLVKDDSDPALPLFIPLKINKLKYEALMQHTVNFFLKHGLEVEAWQHLFVKDFSHFQENLVYEFTLYNGLKSAKRFNFKTNVIALSSLVLDNRRKFRYYKSAFKKLIQQEKRHKIKSTWSKEGYRYVCKLERIHDKIYLNLNKYKASARYKLLR
jgi:hypothetical protein